MAVYNLVPESFLDTITNMTHELIQFQWEFPPSIPPSLYRPNADHAPRTRFARACRRSCQRLPPYPPPPAAATPPPVTRTRSPHRAGCCLRLSRATSGMDRHIPDGARGSPALYPERRGERVPPGDGCVAAAPPLGAATADAAAGRHAHARICDVFSGGENE